MVPGDVARRVTDGGGQGDTSGVTDGCALITLAVVLSQVHASVQIQQIVCFREMVY